MRPRGAGDDTSKRSEPVSRTARGKTAETDFATIDRSSFAAIVTA